MVINEYNKSVIDAWVNGRINLTCALSLLKREDIILDASVVV